MVLANSFLAQPNPIGGMGGNAAIETAAEFINALVDAMIQRGGSLTGLSEEEMSSVFQRTQDSRIDRANFTVSNSHELQALNARESPLIAALVIRVILPLAGKHNFFRNLSATIVGASRLRHLKAPSRPHVMPYEHELPAEPISAPVSRFVWLLFLLGMALLLFDGWYKESSIVQIVNGGSFALIKQAWFKGTTANAHKSGLQAIYLLTNTLAPSLIYTIEGYRLGRYGTLLSLPILFTLGMQVWGMHRIIPVYALLSVLHSGQNTVDRSIPVEVARSLVPSLVIGFGIPTSLIMGATVDGTEWPDWIKLTPALFSALVYIICNVQRLFSTPRPAAVREKNSEWYSNDDVPFLSRAYQLALVVQSTMHIALLASMLLFSNDEPIFPFQYDMITTQLAVMRHIYFEVWELRRKGYISTSSAVKALLGTIFGQLVLGPGATWVTVWSWREKVVSGLSGLHKGEVGI